MARTLLENLRDAAHRGQKWITSWGEVVNVADSIANSTDFTGARVTIDEQHHLGHLGIVFTVSAKLILPASSSGYLVGLTNGSTIHWQDFEFIANEGGIEVTFREGVVYSGGVSIMPVCRNRLSPKVSTFQIFGGPTVTDDGEQLELIGLPIATGPQTRSPISGEDNVEWVLNRTTAYALKFENLEAREKTIYGTFTWYEPGLLE